MYKDIKPQFGGDTLARFHDDMKVVAANLVSVATDWRGDEDRTCLCACIRSSNATGYLLAVRYDENTDPEILELAKTLHEKIQQHFQRQS